jgi:hypothetical protein
VFKRILSVKMMSILTKLVFCFLAPDFYAVVLFSPPAQALPYLTVPPATVKKVMVACGRSCPRPAPGSPSESNQDWAMIGGNDVQ